MYRRISFRDPRQAGHCFHREEARAIVASACDGVALPSDIFHRDAAGHELSGPPSVIITGGRGSITLHGVGRRGADLVKSATPTLFTALFPRGFAAVDTADGEMAMKADGGGYYYINRLVVAKRPRACAPYVRTPILSVKDRIEAIIQSGLEEVAGTLDNARIEAGVAPTYSVGLPSQVEVMEGTPMALPFAPGLYAAAYRDVVFFATATIRGPWTVGKLRSRGYGLVAPRHLGVEGGAA